MKAKLTFNLPEDQVAYDYTMNAARYKDALKDIMDLMRREFKYGENKIRYWKKNTTLTGFFLRKPLVELIPYLRFAGKNLETFSQMTEKANQEHLDKVLPMLSEEQKMILLGK